MALPNGSRHPFTKNLPTRARRAIFRFAMPRFTNLAAYRFASLGELKPLRAELRAKCMEAGMRGTILLSPEGINFFVAAESAACDRLLARLRAIPGLADLRPKISESDQQPFNRMLVKIKKEIIAFGVAGIDPARRPAPRIAPGQLKRWLDEGRAVTLLDARNSYEVKLGTFRGARTLGLDHFREFPAAASALPESLKDAPVVTFCTGGIRCEKAAPLLEHGRFQECFPARWRHSWLFRGMRRRAFRGRLLRLRQTGRARSCSPRNWRRPLLRLPGSPNDSGTGRPPLPGVCLLSLLSRVVRFSAQIVFKRCLMKRSPVSSAACSFRRSSTP